MTQELLGGGAGLKGETKTCNSGGVLDGSPSFPSLSVSLTPTITATDAAAATSSDRQHLRCPRCDSSNTKFCYYNNYNLTQPRHFCKSCRRYWTRGGALRNIPIGGGCRKNKNTSASITVGKSNSGRIKTVPSDIGKSNVGSGFDLEVPSNNPILWASPQYSQLLTFLRATQNPNPISGSVTVKDEGGIIGSHRTFESAMAKGVLDARTLSLDQLNQVPLGLCSSFWRNSQHQPQHQLQNNLLQQHQHSSFRGRMPNSGIQELYQSLRSQENCYSDHSSPSLRNVASSSPSSSSILDPSATAAGEIGIWNPLFSWSNLPPTNGAYP